MSSIITQKVKPTPLSHTAGLNVTGIHGLPEGFPSLVPDDWVGEDLAGKTTWIQHLDSAECVEIRRGLKEFKGKNLTYSRRPWSHHDHE